MKKLFFLTALLCASMMSWAAAVYTGTPFSGSINTYTYNIAYTVTYNDNHTLTFEAVFTGTFTETSGLVFEVWSPDLSNHDHIGFAKGEGNTWSVTDNKDYLSMEGEPLSQLRLRIASQSGGTDQLYLSEYRVGLDNTTPIAPDSVKPVMGEASLDSVTGNSAVINVTATDNIGVTKYHVVDATNSIDALCTPMNGQITVTGLAGSTNYNFTITAKDAAGNESKNSASVAATTPAYYSEPQAAATAPTWPDVQVKAVYSDKYEADCSFGEWSSGTVYTQEEYGKKYITANSGYFGLEGFDLNCVGMEKLHFDIWIADDATIRVVPIWGGAEQGITVSLKGQQWNSVDIALSEYSGITDWSSIPQIKIDQASNLTFWIGNAYFYTTEDPTADKQKPTGVTATLASVDFFSATITASATDDSGTVIYVVKNGETEVASGSGASGANVNITINNLTSGTAYTFNVIAKDVAGNEADPVEVEATTTATPSPAALPTYAVEDVKGVYTDNYTDVAMGIQDWYAGPAVTPILLATGREALYITPNTTPSSCFGLAFPATDITAYNALEMDVYPAAENAVLTIQVIGVSERTIYNLTANEWNHISLSIAGNTKTDCEQIGFYDCNNLKDVTFVQNVLFVQNGGTTAIENAEVSAKAVKMIENGQLVIIKNGVKYNALGAELR